MSVQNTCQAVKFLIFLNLKKKFNFFQKILKLSRDSLPSCHVAAYNHDI